MACQRPSARIVGLTGLAAIAAGCALSTNVAPPVTARMVSAGRGVSAETLKEGRRIFAGPCTACHNADPVSQYSLSEWRAIIDDDMAERSNLDAAARSALLAYIAAVHAAPPPGQR